MEQEKNAYGGETGRLRRAVISIVRSEWGVAGIIAYFFLMGIIGHYWALTRELMPVLTPWVLLVAGIAVVAPYWRQVGRAGRIWVAGTYVVTYFLEVLGVATGMVFGDYVYGYALGLRLLEVPVLIGFNWVLVILGFLRASQHLFIRGKADTRRGRGLLLVTASVLIPAAGAVVFDYIMEPVAIELEYWIWAAGKVPLQNYLAWFLIALAASLAFRLTRITFSSMLPFYYAVIQMLFFIGLYWV